MKRDPQGLVTNPDPEGFVYVIGAPGSSMVKIGKSLDPAVRLASIQRMSPVRLAILWQHQGDHRLERALHLHFADRRSHGEWFEFGREDPVTCISRAVSAWLDPPQQHIPEGIWREMFGPCYTSTYPGPEHLAANSAFMHELQSAYDALDSPASALRSIEHDQPHSR